MTEKKIQLPPHGETTIKVHRTISVHMLESSQVEDYKEHLRKTQDYEMGEHVMAALHAGWTAKPAIVEEWTGGNYNDPLHGYDWHRLLTVPISKPNPELLGDALLVEVAQQFDIPGVIAGTETDEVDDEGNPISYAAPAKKKTGPLTNAAADSLASFMEKMLLPYYSGLFYQTLSKAAQEDQDGQKEPEADE